MDPILGDYLTGRPNNGVYRSVNLSLYTYAAANPVVYSDPDGNCFVGNGQIDCISGPLANQATLSAGVADDLRSGNYGMATAGAVLYLANTVNVAAGFAEQALVQPGNSTYKATSGFIEGNYDKALMGSVETLAIFGPARLLPSSSAAAPGVAAPQSIRSGAGVTPEAIQNALRGDSTMTTQGAVSLPAVKRYVDMLASGKTPPAIKMDGNVIVDGNHRYIAGKLFGQTPEVQAATMAPSQASRMKPVSELKIDPTDWGNF